MIALVYVSLTALSFPLSIYPFLQLFFDYRYNVGMDNDLILKPGKTVDWMKNPKMANQIRKTAS